MEFKSYPFKITLDPIERIEFFEDGRDIFTSQIEKFIAEFGQVLKCPDNFSISNEMIVTDGHKNLKKTALRISNEIFDYPKGIPFGITRTYGEDWSGFALFSVKICLPSYFKNNKKVNPSLQIFFAVESEIYCSREKCCGYCHLGKRYNSYVANYIKSYE